MSKPRKTEPGFQPTLFELQAEAVPPVRQNLERNRAHGILLGTSSFTAKGWEGVFYPAGMKSQDFLHYYSQQFRAVEIDSTFYGTPKATTVENWRKKTPADFIFALKIPQVITHEKVLVGCEPEFDEFVETMSLLGEKLGPMLFQFPKFDKWTLSKPEELINRLDSFLGRVTSPSLRFVVEIRNKNWFVSPLLEFLRGRNVALALTDTSFVPRPWEAKEPLDLVTSDFAYVRWLGDRKGIEQVTTNWNKPIVDREPEIRRWVDLLNQMVLNKQLRTIFAFANNHYAGHAPDTVRLFERLWASR